MSGKLLRGGGGTDATRLRTEATGGDLLATSFTRWSTSSPRCSASPDASPTDCSCIGETGVTTTMQGVKGAPDSCSCPAAMAVLHAGDFFDGTASMPSGLVTPVTSSMGALPSSGNSKGLTVESMAACGTNVDVSYDVLKSIGIDSKEVAIVPVAACGPCFCVRGVSTASLLFGVTSSSPRLATGIGN